MRLPFFFGFNNQTEESLVYNKVASLVYPVIELPINALATGPRSAWRSLM
jgi:hypothetical protein